MNKTATNPFRDLHHVCVVVHDIEAAVAYYESLGIGPWQVFPSLEIYRDGLNVPDVDAFMELQYRYCNLDNIQIQLCQPGDGKSPQRQFLDSKGEGVFHLGFTVGDLDASEDTGKTLGLTPWMRARLDDKSGFTYFNTRELGAGVTLEIRANKRD